MRANKSLKRSDLKDRDTLQGLKPEIREKA